MNRTITVIRCLRYILIPIVFLLIPATGLNASDCAQTVRAIYKLFAKSMTAKDKGKASYLRCRIQVEAAGGRQAQKSQDTMELFVSLDDTRLITREVQVYYRKGFAYTIIPTERTIYIDRLPTGEGRKRIEETMLMVQDSILTSAQLQSCTERIISSDETELTATYSFSKQQISKYQIKTLQCAVNKNQQTLRKMVITYPSGGPIDRITTIYDAVDLNVPFNNISAQVGKFPLDAKGKAIPSFRHFLIKDNTK